MKIKPEGITKGQLPPFHSLDEYIFQDLCRDLYDAEAEIATCEVYGTRGQSQDGIDLLSHRIKNDGIEVGQCKCYKTFSASQISSVSNDFFEYWNRWSLENVRRFILFVACDLSDRKIQDEIQIQRKRFEKFNIVYECWGAAKIRNKLRPHHSIVNTYLDPGEYWIGVICGGPTPPYHQDRPEDSIIIAVLENQIENFGSIVSGHVDNQLNSIGEAWRSGKQKEATKALHQLIENKQEWAVLQPKIKVKVLHLAASFELRNSGDLEKVKKLIGEAKSIEKDVDQILISSLIAYYEHGPEPALEILKDKDELDSLNFSALLMLEKQCYGDCNDILIKIYDTHEADAETYRINSILHLVKKEISKAQILIKKALDLQPGWESIRFTSAVIDYFNALSPAIFPDFPPTWPEPVDWDYVKQDNNSLSCMRSALKIFKNLRDSSSNMDKYHSYEVWRFACVANDPDKQDEASNQCDELLKANPQDFKIIAWALSRKYTFDIENCKNALENIIDDEQVQIPQVLALVGCYVTLEQDNIAVKLLKRKKPLFSESVNSTDLWTLWLVQSANADDIPESLKKTPSKELLSIQQMEIKTIVLQQNSIKSGEWEKIKEHLEYCYKKTKKPLFLFELCKLMSSKGNWVYVSGKSDLLIDEIQTPESVRIAILAYYNTKKFEKCIQLLDKYRNLFPHEILPPELRRMRVTCLLEQGALSEAITDADNLVKDNPSADNFIALANLYFRKGDLKSLVVLIYKLLDKINLTSDNLLQLAQLVILEDKLQAITLFNKAIKLGIPDELVGSAIELGFMLNQERSLKPLYSRISELASVKNSNVQLASIEDFRQFIEQKRDRESYVFQMYREGVVPIHMLASELPLLIPHFYHANLSYNQSAPYPNKQFALYARHGGREIVDRDPENETNPRVIIDLTSIILAHHFGILSAIESELSPLYIPPDLVPSLIHINTQVGRQQPSRIKTFESIIASVEQEKIQVLKTQLIENPLDQNLVAELGRDRVVLFEEIRSHQRQAHLVEFLPLRKINKIDTPVVLPSDSVKYFVNCHAVIYALRKSGIISEDSFNEAIENMGDEGAQSLSVTIPEKGAVLVCCSLIIEILLSSGVFLDVCNNFQILIPELELDQVKSQLSAIKGAEETKIWIGNLINKINRGLDQESYKIIPYSSSFSPEEEQKHNPKNPIESCLFTLMTFETQEDDLICSDDRFFNSYIHRDKAKIIGISELLINILRKGAIQSSDYYHKLNQLRSANVRFLPTSKDEILYNLNQTIIDNDSVLETKELGVLRRYILACLVDNEALQVPPVRENIANKNGEIAFIISCNREVFRAIAALWSKTVKYFESVAKSNWLIDNLYSDYTSTVNDKSEERNLEKELYIVALSLAGLISQSIGIDYKERGNDNSPRQNYLNWLYRKLLRKKFDAEPKLIPLTTEIIKNSFFGMELSPEGINSRSKVHISILNRFYHDLPECIQNELAKDSTFMAEIGISMIPIVNIGNLNFVPEEFWPAAIKAINGKLSSASLVDTGDKIEFQPVEDIQGDHIFIVPDSKNEEKIRVNNPLLQMLRKSNDEVEKKLYQYRGWFDCSADNFEKIVAQIIALKDPVKRIGVVENWQKNSLPYLYSTIHESIVNTGKIQFDDFVPPNEKSLLQYLRLVPTQLETSSFEEIICLSTRKLLEEEGIKVTFERLTGIPTPLPSLFVESISNLSQRERRQFFRWAHLTSKSPISKIHLVYLLGQFATESFVYSGLMKINLISLLDAGTAEKFETFLSVMTWFSQEVSCWEEFGKLPTNIQLTLIWVHSHQLFTIFLLTDRSVEKLKDIFIQKRQDRLTSELFHRDELYSADICNPINTNWPSFIVSSLSYCVNSNNINIIDSKINSLIRSVIFPERTTVDIPSIFIVRDPTLSNNSLGSFLGRDRYQQLSKFIDDDSASEFSAASLEALSREHLNKIEEKNDTESWLMLSAIIFDQMPYNSIKDQLQSVLMKTDLVSLFRENPHCAHTVSIIIAQQVLNLNSDELCIRLREQLMKLCSYFSSLPGSYQEPLSGGIDADFEFEKFKTILIELAYKLSIYKGTENDVLKEFSEIINELCDIWYELAQFSHPMIRRLCLELPVNQASHLWRLSSKLRTF